MGKPNAYGSQGGGGDGEGTPSASSKEVSTQEGSQSEGQEPQGNEQYVTRQDLETLKEEVIRQAQSMTDKMGSRLDKEIQSALTEATRSIELAKEAGMEFTPQMEQAIRDKAINKAYANLNQQQPSSPQVSGNLAQQQTQQTQEQGNQPSSFVEQEVHRIMAETGVYISPDEANRLIIPEGETLTPYQYIQAFEQIAKQRQQNISQPQGPNPNIPSYVSGGKPASPQTALRREYEKELRQIRDGSHPKIRRGDLPAIQRLEIEYRKKGLDI